MGMKECTGKEREAAIEKYISFSRSLRLLVERESRHGRNALSKRELSQKAHLEEVIRGMAAIWRFNKTETRRINRAVIIQTTPKIRRHK
jgi:hypothetical protein